MEQNTRTFSRRSFISTSLAGVAGLSVLSLKSCGKSGDLRLGFIGLGRQANYLQTSFLGIEGIEVVAGADVYQVKRERFLQKAMEFYKEQEKKVNVKVYADYRDLLSRKDIDAVVIASPDHWHARMAIDACLAGKDIYLEKPLTFTIKEGIELVKAVRENDRILAVGSQQRSDDNFKYAVELVRSGRLGKLESVSVFVGNDPHPVPYDQPAEPIPAGLDWNAWIGPAPFQHFNKELNPPISLNPIENEQFWGGWRWYKEFGGGLMTDWGAHMIDIAQWGMEVDKSGPVRVVPAGFEDAEYLTFEYKDAPAITVEPFNGDIRGVKFKGENGWIEVARGFFNASSPEFYAEEVEDTEVPYEGRSAHHVDFIESVRQHKDPVVPVEIGHRTCTACTLANIAHELGRPVNWDPDGQKFVNDPEAEKYFHREYENGFSL